MNQINCKGDQTLHLKFLKIMQVRQTTTEGLKVREVSVVQSVSVASTGREIMLDFSYYPTKRHAMVSKCCVLQTRAAGLVSH